MVTATITKTDKVFALLKILLALSALLSLIFSATNFSVPYSNPCDSPNLAITTIEYNTMLIRNCYVPRNKHDENNRIWSEKF